MSGLVRKSHLVASGHTTDTPSSITYSSVVLRESVAEYTPDRAVEATIFLYDLF